MRSLLYLILLVAVSIAAEPKELVGKWYAVGQTASCEVKYENGMMQAYVIDNPADSTMIGVHLFQDLKWNEGKKRWEGFVYDHSKDKKWKGKFVMKGNNTFYMIVKWMGIGRKDQWDRIKK